MSAIEEAIQRAKQRSGPSPKPSLPSSAIAILDRDQSRERYIINRPGSGPMEVVFNPPQTIAEVRAMYPECGVSPG